jgi:F0F1-type ATP synthase assembly protein I
MNPSSLASNNPVTLAEIGPIRWVCLVKKAGISQPAQISGAARRRDQWSTLALQSHYPPMERSSPDTTLANDGSGQRRAKSRSIQMLGAGFELAVTVGMAIGAGSFLDKFLQNDTPVFAAVFALVGFGLAMTRFIIRANRMTQQSGSVPPETDRTRNKTQ